MDCERVFVCLGHLFALIMLLIFTLVCLPASPLSGVMPKANAAKFIFLFSLA